MPVILIATIVLSHQQKNFNNILNKKIKKLFESTDLLARYEDDDGKVK